MRISLHYLHVYWIQERRVMQWNQDTEWQCYCYRMIYTGNSFYLFPKFSARFSHLSLMVNLMDIHELKYQHLKNKFNSTFESKYYAFDFRGVEIERHSPINYENWINLFLPFFNYFPKLTVPFIMMSHLYFSVILLESEIWHQDKRNSKYRLHLMPSFQA